MLYNLNKNTKWIISYYTIKIILGYNIQNINTILHLFITSILDKYAARIIKLYSYVQPDMLVWLLQKMQFLLIKK